MVSPRPRRRASSRNRSDPLEDELEESDDDEELLSLDELLSLEDEVDVSCSLFVLAGSGLFVPEPPRLSFL